jgi:hypothetical protein
VATDPVEEAADRLYGLPLEDFVPERDARARELRKAGEKDAAAQVAKLPKPSQVAWAANQLARGGVDELLQAGEALREAQLGGGGREALRAATAAERAAVEGLVRSAPKPGGRAMSRAALDRLRALLGAVARDESVRSAFVAGRLVEEPGSGGAWPSGAFVAPASTPALKGGTKGEGASKARGGRRDAAERRRREAREREAAERREREAAQKRQEAERRRLERRLQAARDAAEAARDRLEAARDAYESATHEVARIEEQLS